MYTLRLLPKLFLFLSSLCIYDALYSQVEWFKNGQVFSYYVRTGFDDSNYGIHSIEVIGDTMIDGLSLKKLQYNFIASAPYIFYVYREGDKAFEYSTFFHNSKLMYDFGLTVGESAPLSNFKIISEGEIQFNNAMYRTQTWKKEDTEVLLIEGVSMVGDPNFISKDVCSPFVPQWSCTGYVDGNDYYFRCFSDEDYIFDPFNTCTSSLANFAIDELNIIPNPNNGSFALHPNLTIDYIQVFNTLGNLVLTSKRNEGNRYQIADELSDGIYFVVGIHSDKSVLVKRMMVIH